VTIDRDDLVLLANQRPYPVGEFFEQEAGALVPDQLVDLREIGRASCRERV